MPRALPYIVLAVAAIAVIAWGISSSLGETSSGPPPSGIPPTQAAEASPTAGQVATPIATPAASPAPTGGATSSPVYESPSDLVVGNCYDPIPDSDDDRLLAALIRPCAQPHAAEVFGLGFLLGVETAPFPGREDVNREATDLCDAFFETYVGIAFDDSKLGYLYFTPTESSWSGGDRRVMCVAEDDGRPITGTIKGSRR